MLQGLHRRQVGGLQKAQGVVYVFNVAFQRFGDHLGPAAGQLLQIKLAHLGGRLAGARPGAGSYPDRCNQQNDGDGGAAPQGEGDGLPRADIVKFWPDHIRKSFPG